LGLFLLSDVDESFMPWLMKEVTHELKDIVSSRDVLTGNDSD
jgi:hypothetical protein